MEKIVGGPEIALHHGTRHCGARREIVERLLQSASEIGIARLNEELAASFRRTPRRPVKRVNRAVACLLALEQARTHPKVGKICQFLVRRALGEFIGKPDFHVAGEQAGEDTIPGIGRIVRINQRDHFPWLPRRLGVEWSVAERVCEEDESEECSQQCDGCGDMIANLLLSIHADGMLLRA